MKIPTKIIASGITYSVRRGNHQNHIDTWGLADHVKQVILLDPEVQAEREAETFLHELIHLAVDASGIKEFIRDKQPMTEEQIVAGIARSLHAIIQDNRLDFRT